MNLPGILTKLKNSTTLAPLVGMLRAFLNKRRTAMAASHPLRFFNIQHRLYYGKKLDLDNPRTLYEKIMILEYCCDTSLQTRLSDKVAVRDYLRELGYGKYLNEVFHVFDEMPSYEEFIAALPQSCVVKTNHSGGGEAVAVIEDKEMVNLKEVYGKMRRSMADDYGARTGAPHYSAIKPKIMVEKYLRNEKDPRFLVNDYKFYCVNGEPLFVNVIVQRDIKAHTMHLQYFDTDWNPLGTDTENAPDKAEAPECLAEMVSLARELAQPVPFVRIDFYEVGGRIIFGEFTFAPGMEGFLGTYGENVLHLGDRLDISAVPRLREPQPSWF